MEDLQEILTWHIVPVTLKVRFAVNILLTPIPREIWHVLTVMSLLELEACMACNFIDLIKTEGQRQSHKHCSCDNISETVQDRRYCYRLLIGSE